MIMHIRDLSPEELHPGFLWDFDNYHLCLRVWERDGEGWSLRPARAVRQWNSEKKGRIVRYLRWLLEEEGGRVVAAFVEGKLAGFLALGGVLCGSRKQYLNLSLLFVDARYRRHGAGKYLFAEGVKRAAAMGAEKLFISAVPAEDTVAFYFAMGCRDARETVSEFVDMPFDRCMEYTVAEGTKEA